MADRRAVVVGGSRGIGRAVVERLALDGHRVLATGRDAAALDQLRQDLAVVGTEVDTVVADAPSPNSSCSACAVCDEATAASFLASSSCSLSHSSKSADMSPYSALFRCFLAAVLASRSLCLSSSLPFCLRSVLRLRKPFR